MLAGVNYCSGVYSLSLFIEIFLRSNWSLADTVCTCLQKLGLIALVDDILLDDGKVDPNAEFFAGFGEFDTLFLSILFSRIWFGLTDLSNQFLQVAPNA